MVSRINERNAEGSKEVMVVMDHSSKLSSKGSEDRTRRGECSVAGVVEKRSQRQLKSSNDNPILCTCAACVCVFA